VRGVRSQLKGQGCSDHNKSVVAGGMPMSFTETVQQSGQLLDYIKNHPIDWNLAIAWIVIVAVGWSLLNFLNLDG
jgi:hypothetical protein